MKVCVLGLGYIGLPTRIETAPPRPGEIAPARVSSAKAAEVLGWRAEVPFRQGLDELIEAHVSAGAAR